MWRTSTAAWRSRSRAITDTNNIQSVNELNWDTIQGGTIHKLTATKENNQLIPGYDRTKPASQRYEKGIHYSWVNVRSDIDGEIEDTYVYLGFQIPFTYFDFNFSDIDWDQNFSATQTNKTNYEKGIEPFYQNWSIKIPRGTTGNHIGYLRRVKFGDFINENSSKTEVLYDFKDLYDDSTGKFHWRDYIETPWSSQYRYPHFENVTIDSDILVYTFYMYDRSFSGNKRKIVTCFLAAIKDIVAIELRNNGELFITYSSGETLQLNQLKWINKIGNNLKG